MHIIQILKETKEDILKFYEFYHQEYELLGLDVLVEQHPNFPNLRACSILYSHIVWKSTMKQEI